MESADNRTNSCNLMPRLLKRDTNGVELQAYTNRENYSSGSNEETKAAPSVPLCHNRLLQSCLEILGEKAQIRQQCNNSGQLVVWISKVVLFWAFTQRIESIHDKKLK
jgi:hypothetical protein